MADPDYPVCGTGSDARKQSGPPLDQDVSPRPLGQLPLTEHDPVTGTDGITERVPPLVSRDRRDAARSLLQVESIH